MKTITRAKYLDRIIELNGTPDIIERMGLVPMVNEYSKVMAFSAKTLFNGDNLGDRKSVV